MALLKLCIAPGCDDLAEDGGNRCPDHAAAVKAKRDVAKAAAKTSAVARIGSQLYQSRAWKAASRSYRQQHPLCVECQSLGIVTASQEVDHIEPHHGNLALFWKRSNWQALCKPCHSRKTAGEVFHQRKGVGG